MLLERRFCFADLSFLSLGKNVAEPYVSHFEPKPSLAMPKRYTLYPPMGVGRWWIRGLHRAKGNYFAFLTPHKPPHNTSFWICIALLLSQLQEVERDGEAVK